MLAISSKQQQHAVGERDAVFFKIRHERNSSSHMRIAGDEIASVNENAPTVGGGHSSADKGRRCSELGTSGIFAC